FVLIAIAMAYAIIDVPSTGKARLRLPQSRFLIFRQLPLLLASLILAAWWAVFRNVHGSEQFQPKELLPWFVGFTVVSYLTGGLIALAILFLHKGEKEKIDEAEKEKLRESEKKARRRRVIGSLIRLGTIVLTAVFAGFCLWAMATRLFLAPYVEFTLKR